MIERLIRDFLSERTSAGRAVYCEKPQNPVQKYILIEKLGSGSDNQIKTASIAIQSINTTLYKTMQLNEEIKEVMGDIDTLPEICSCGLNSDYNFTDTKTKEYRYQAVFDITHY